MNTTTIILIITSSLLLVISVVLLILFFITKNRNKNITKKNKDKQNKLNSLIDEYQQKINNVLKVDESILRQEISNQIKIDEYKKLNNELNEMKTNVQLIANNILIDSMQTMLDQVVQENTITSFKIEDEQMKGRIIGKDGRNKKTFEQLTGTDLIIEKTSNIITISSFNPIRREIALKLLSRLVKNKSIDPTRIENIYDEIKQEFDKHLYEVGKDVVENIFQIKDLNPEIYPYLGRMKYRSSYNQNSLQHIIECARLAKKIAYILELDQNIAVKTSLLHDIGKSIDFELNTNHIDAGSTLAKNLDLDEKIINAIESHHETKSSNSIYSEITKIVDTISSSRPGARLNASNEYFERLQEIEKIISEFKEVNQCYVLKSARYVRVIVNPLYINDSQLSELGLRIKQKIENNTLTKGYNIKVCLIKENKFEFETDNKFINN